VHQHKYLSENATHSIDWIFWHCIEKWTFVKIKTNVTRSCMYWLSIHVLRFILSVQSKRSLIITNIWKNKNSSVDCFLKFVFLILFVVICSEMNIFLFCTIILALMFIFLDRPSTLDREISQIFCSSSNFVTKVCIPFELRIFQGDIFSVVNTHNFQLDKTWKTFFYSHIYWASSQRLYKKMFFSIWKDLDLFWYNFTR
jgi:hypothetical protein